MTMGANDPRIAPPRTISRPQGHFGESLNDRFIPGDPGNGVNGDAGLPATGGGKDEIASQIRETLGGGNEPSIQDKSPHEQMRRQIGEALERKIDPTKPPSRTAKTERARGPDGRFVPTPQEAAAGIDPNAQPDTTVQPEVPPALRSRGSKEMQARWVNSHRTFRAIIQKREADVAKGFEKYRTFGFTSQFGTSPRPPPNNSEPAARNSSYMAAAHED